MEDLEKRMSPIVMRSPVGRSTRRAWLLLLLATLAPLGAHACSPPRAPIKYPDGLTATQDEMVTSMHTLQRYRLDVDNFVKCLEFEASQNRIPRESQAIQHNTAVETLRIVADKFNEQVRIFKERQAAAVIPAGT
jgi:hypothetical protein